MDSMSIWLVIGAAVAIAGICVILLQKKAGEARTYLDELQTLRNQVAEQTQHNEDAQTNDGVAQDLQNKIDGLSATLQSAKDQNTQLQAELTQTREKLNQAEVQITELTASEASPAATSETNEDGDAFVAEITSLKQELAEKNKELASVEERFEKQMEEVVQSSIQKISHAEEAKEEAIQAAQDNFEAAAEANARLKEKEELIKQLQG